MYGFSCPESILADQNDLFPVFVTEFEKRELCNKNPQNHIISNLLSLNM